MLMRLVWDEVKLDIEKHHQPHADMLRSTSMNFTLPESREVPGFSSTATSNQ